MAPDTGPRARRPWWVIAVVLLAGALALAGGIIALARPQVLLPAGATTGDGVRVYADYLVSRDLALAVALALLLALRADRLLGATVALYALIQIFDVVLDAATGRWILVPGLAVLTALLLIASTRLLGASLTRAATWRGRP